MIADGTSIEGTLTFSDGRAFVTPSGTEVPLILPDTAAQDLRSLNGVETPSKLIYRGYHWYVSVAGTCLYITAGHDVGESLRALV